MMSAVVAAFTTSRGSLTQVFDSPKLGDIVRVKVLEVDMARKRIALTLRLDDGVGSRADRAGTVPPRNDGGRPASRGPSHNAAPVRPEEQGGGALADALRRAGLAEKRK